MITDQIEQHEVLLPINRIYNKNQERNKSKTFQEKNSFHPEMRSKENTKVQLSSSSARWHVLSNYTVIAGESQWDARILL